MMQLFLSLVFLLVISLLGNYVKSKTMFFWCLILLFFVYSMFPIFYYFFRHPKYLSLNIDLRKIFYCNSNDIKRENNTGLSPIVGFLIFINLLFLWKYMWIKILTTTRWVGILLLLIVGLSTFFRLDNIIPYFFLKISLQGQYRFMSIIYLIKLKILKNWLPSKIFVTNPGETNLKKIINIENGVIYTDIAVIKK